MVSQFFSSRGAPVCGSGNCLAVVVRRFADEHSHDGKKQVVAWAEHPEWMDKLQGQVDREENESGLKGRSKKLEYLHEVDGKGKD